MASKFDLTTGAALAVIALSAGAASAQTLTRIETHAFYGATVTVEEGVRVFRPLPSTGHMIINPGGRTPVNVSINDTVHHYVGSAAAAAPSGDGGNRFYGGGGGLGLPWVPGDGRGVKNDPNHKGKLVGNPGPGGMKHLSAPLGGAKSGGKGGHGH